MKKYLLISGQAKVENGKVFVEIIAETETLQQAYATLLRQPTSLSGSNLEICRVVNLNNLRITETQIV